MCLVSDILKVLSECYCVKKKPGKKFNLSLSYSHHFQFFSSLLPFLFFFLLLVSSFKLALHPAQLASTVSQPPSLTTPARARPSNSSLTFTTPSKDQIRSQLLLEYNISTEWEEPNFSNSKPTRSAVKQASLPHSPQALIPLESQQKFSNRLRNFCCTF